MNGRQHTATVRPSAGDADRAVQVGEEVAAAAEEQRLGRERAALGADGSL